MERGEATLVGREEERARLVALIEADRPVAVVGEAGIGKTSLIRAAASSCGRLLHEGGGFATLSDAPLLALRRAIDVPIAGDEPSVAGAIEQRVGPDVLFVDDLHWADRSTLAVLRLLGGRIGLVVAIRLGDPGTRAALAVARELGMAELALTGLKEEDARQIVRQARPRLSEPDVDRVVARSGGNPLLLAELAARGEPSLALTRSLRGGLDHLPAPAREMLELLAVIDRPIELRHVPGPTPEADLAGFLIERGGELEIRHALIAEAIRDGLDDSRKRALHERAADLVQDPAEAAGHLARAGQPARAAATAEAALAVTSDPVRRARLLVLIAEAAGPAGRPGPRLAAAAALAAVSDWEGIVRILEADDDVGSSEELGERHALLAHACYSLGRNEEARSLLDRASALGLDPSSPAMVQLAIERAAFLVNVDGQLLRGIEDLTAVLDHLSPDGAAYHTVRPIVESMRLLAVLPVDIEYLRGTVEAALAAGRFATAADLARVVNFALLIWKEPDDACRFVDDVGGRLAAAGARGAALECRSEAVQASMMAGRPAEAVTRADELLELPAALRARQTASIFRARALGIMGRLEEAARCLTGLEPTVTSDFVGRGELLAAQADIALWGGLTERAVALVNAVTNVPSPALGAYTMPELTRAWAQLEMGTAPQPASGIIDAPTQAGASSEVAGLMQLHAGRAGPAARLFAEAAAAWAGHHAVRELWCRWAQGEALRRAGEIAGATERLEAALAIATERRIEVVALRIRRSLRLAGRRLPAERTPRASGLGLTQRERQIVDLAGGGLTNAEIARRMGLGRPTVARILSNAMSKLGAGSRAHAVRLVAEEHAKAPEDEPPPR